LLASCGNRLNKRVTLWRNYKIPYGTFYAYENLPHLFKNSEIAVNDKSPTTFYSDDSSSSAYIIIGHRVIPDERELKAILNHAITGNHVFISAFSIGKNLLDSFRLDVSSSAVLDDSNDSMALSIVDPAGPFTFKYYYPGYKLGRHFTKMDSSVTNILGRDEDGLADFVKFTYQGGGTVMIHLEPTAFSNFFLLHKQNKKYYDLAMASIPDSVEHVRWDDYYRHHTFGEDNASRSAFSKLGTFIKDEVLRWAFWLTLLLFALIYLFESKRKQRVVPILKKLDNTSLDFVKTVGQLYFQRKDNKNLATKMSTHLLGHIRTRFNLNTSQLDDEFAKKLAFKSGQSIELVNDLIAGIKEVEEAYQMSDDQLLSFSDKIDTFINKA
jgi:hypothetical protein